MYFDRNRWHCNFFWNLILAVSGGSRGRFQSQNISFSCSFWQKNCKIIGWRPFWISPIHQWIEFVKHKWMFTLWSWSNWPIIKSLCTSKCYKTPLIRRKPAECCYWLFEVKEALHRCSLLDQVVNSKYSAFFYNSRLIRWIEQNNIFNEILDLVKRWTQIIYLTVNYSNPYTRKFFCAILSL